MVRQRTIVALGLAGALVLSGMVALNLASAATGLPGGQGTYSLWDDSATPRTVAHPDPQPVELGVRFIADRDGEIHGVRYYKSQSNTGVHHGSLWTADGSRLARVRFVNETRFGWQYAAFSRPVAVKANAGYVVSYHTQVGAYSADNYYFSASRGVGPLSAPADDARRSNGVYRYGASGFPNRSYKATNYWVDVVFKPGAPAMPSQTPPTPTATARPAPSVSVSAVPSVSSSPSPRVSSSPAGAPSSGVSAGVRCAVARSHVPGGPNGSGGCWPGPGNTGVPAGTALTAYTGPCTMTDSTPKASRIIDSKVVNCDLRLLTSGVVIRKSRINGTISNGEKLSYSFTLEDSEVDGGFAEQPAVWHTNMTILRSSIQGGQTSVSCWWNCTVRDSWLHGQKINPGRSAHLGGFLSNGGKGVTLVNNSIVCDSPGDGGDGGCSGDVNLFGDFEPVSTVQVDRNLLGANSEISYCIYGGDGPSKPYHTDHVVFTNNVVQRGNNRKCGYYGPVTGFDPDRPGNLWQNNKWDDGTTLNSAY